MAHGQPDFGMYGQKATVFALSDMAELAARLGSIVTFDRRGDVIWLDDFESTANRWVADYTGGDGTWALSETAQISGKYAGKLTTALSAGATAFVRRSLSYPVSSKYGYEIGFSIDALADPLEFRIEISDATYITTFKIVYDHSAETLTLVDENNASQTIDASFALVAGYWNKLKLVIDLATRKYVRLVINSFSWNLSAYGGYSQAVSVPYLVNNYVFITAASAMGGKVYLDDCILTQNEP